jgi:hypothetical protein
MKVEDVIHILVSMGTRFCPCKICAYGMKKTLFDFKFLLLAKINRNNDNSAEQIGEAVTVYTRILQNHK